MVKHAVGSLGACNANGSTDDDWQKLERVPGSRTKEDFLPKTEMSTPISEFYRDRSVFITGATGFMGKVLVEKLLRSCPGIRRIYLLMRPKKSHDVGQRLTEMLIVEMFQKIRQAQPEILKKLVAIKGDISEPELGISQSNMELLCEEVSVVFHVAATVRFDEPLKVAVDMNVVGTKRVVELAKKMTKLESLVHVSTAYCNCDREEVNETVYPLPIKPQLLMDLVQWPDNELMKNITPHLIGGRPNTYTFTKAMAEYMLVEDYANLPIAVVRPSIVTAAWKDPMPGWGDNFNGPVGIFLASGKGLLRTTCCKLDCVIDCIPVDIPINLMIAVGWHTATHRPNNMMIYNCTSGGPNPVTFRSMGRYTYNVATKNPLNRIFWIPACNTYSNRLLYRLDMLRSYIPAYLMDFVTWIGGGKGNMVDIQDKIHRANEVLAYFTTKQWSFTNDNLRALWGTLGQEDKELFPLDVTQVQWQPYWIESWLGGKQFVLKEDMSNLTAARKHFRRMLVVSNLYGLFKLLLLWRLLVASFGLLRRHGSHYLSLYGESHHLTRFLKP